MITATDDAERIIKAWQAAFAEAHGKTPPIVTWANGWFRIGDAGKRYRRAEIESMTKVLRKGFTD